MSTLLLVRHALCEGAGERIWGRTPGVHLTNEGRQQAHALSQRSDLPGFDVIYTSPLERTRETAELLAARWHIQPRTDPDLNEIDYGEWTGRAIAELAEHPRWHAFNSCRSLVTPPGGESLAAVQRRALAACARIAGLHPGETVALVTHGDVIRAVLCANANMSLDRIFEFTVDYASTHFFEER